MPLKRLKKKQKTQRKMPKKLLKTLKKKLNNTAKLYRKTDSNDLESVFCFVS